VNRCTRNRFCFLRKVGIFNQFEYSAKIMKIFELLRNPIIKTIGVILVLYFALFANKKNPDSLGNRLSANNIKKHFNKIQEKGRFIAANVKIARELEQERKGGKIREKSKEQKITKKSATQNLQDENNSQIIITKLQNESSENKVSCGDIVEISYGLYSKKGKEIKLFEPQKLTIGSNKNQLIENNIPGMKNGATKDIEIPSNFKSDDKNLTKLLKLHGNLKYRVKILALKKVTNPKIICY
jgi:hypothetical protein